MQNYTVSRQMQTPVILEDISQIPDFVEDISKIPAILYTCTCKDKIQEI